MGNNKYKKIFGIGPLGALISLVLILPFWWLDKKLGHPLISQNPALLRMFGCLLIITVRGSIYGRDGHCATGGETVNYEPSGRSNTSAIPCMRPGLLSLLQASAFALIPGYFYYGRSQFSRYGTGLSLKRKP